MVKTNTVLFNKDASAEEWKIHGQALTAENDLKYKFKIITEMGIQFQHCQSNKNRMEYRSLLER